MKFTGTLIAPRIDIEQYRKILHEELYAAICEAVIRWLEPILAKVPVWSGASHATFLPLARQIGQPFPIAPVVGSRIGIGEGASIGELEPGTNNPNVYSFLYNTTLPWLIVNEYHDATQWGFNLRNPGPYHFQELGRVAFEQFARGVRLPSVKRAVKTERFKV